MNLFGADYLRHVRQGRGAEGRPADGAGPAGVELGPQLPGNPVAARLPPAAIPRLLLVLAAAGAAALLYFALTVGPGVLAFLLPAAAVGALYVFSPFPYAFLGTALVPPLVAGGVAFVLLGRVPPACLPERSAGEPGLRRGHSHLPGGLPPRAAARRLGAGPGRAPALRAGGRGGGGSPAGPGVPAVRVLRAASGHRVPRLGRAPAVDRISRPGAGHRRGRIPAQHAVPGDRRRLVLG